MPKLRAATYTRISKDDPEDPRLGVQRQAEDLDREAARRSADIVARLEDNDRSGSGLVHRPDFERLIDAIRNREVDLVLAIDLDRLTRGWKPYVRLYEACEEAQIQVGWLGGTADFATGTGLLEMELRASFAREELRKIKSRTRRKHDQLYEQGRDAGGGRPFGYEADRHTVIAVEADLIREASDRALQGEPLSAIARDWNQRCIPSPWAGRSVKFNGSIRTVPGYWTAPGLRRVLCSGRISGRRERQRIHGKKAPVGQTGKLIPADWPAIISVDLSDRLRALLTAPGRGPEGHPRKYQLSGMLTCGSCGHPMYSLSEKGGQRRSYGCLKRPGYEDHCGRIRVNADPLEKYVMTRIFAAVDEGALSRILGSLDEDPLPAQELAQIEVLLDQYAREGAKLGPLVLLSATQELERQRQELTRQVERQRRRLNLDGLTAETPLREEFPLMPLHRQRAVIRLFLKAITVRPATRRGPVFDTSRVQLEGTVSGIFDFD